MSKLKVYIDTTSWFIRPKNTDWLYMHWLNQMSDYVPVEFVYEFNLKEIVSESFNYVSERFRPRFMNAGYKEEDRYVRQTHSRIISKGLADVVFSHSRFPVLKSDVPVVWFYGVVDPAMQIARGATVSEIDKQYFFQGDCFRKSAKALQPTKAQMNRHAAYYPDLKDKFTYAPFFLPGIKRLSVKDVTAKQQGGSKIRLLFVGREGKRKGLDILVKALSMLDKSERKNFALEVVCAMSDGLISLESGVDTKWHKSLPRNKVLDLMRSAHVFVMPSRFESYGFTFIEALASGCVVIGPNWEAQNEILDFGLSGINVSTSASCICSSLKSLLDWKIRSRLALSGLEKFQKEYSPENVSQLHMDVFESAIAR